MKVRTAVTWAFPIWLAAMAVVAALMHATDLVREVGREEAAERYALLAVISFPVIAWMIKRTADDWTVLREPSAENDTSKD